MHSLPRPIRPPIQIKLAPGDRLILHSLGVCWEDPKQIEAPKKEVVVRKDISNA